MCTRPVFLLVALGLVACGARALPTDLHAGDRVDGAHDGSTLRDLDNADAGWMDTPCGRARWGDDQSEVCVPAGPFVRGRDGKPEITSTPKRVLTLSAFFIDRYEVTNRRYKRCVAAGVCRRLTQPDLTQLPNFENAPPNHPVASILKQDARTFCEWDGRRLPTEAEWEKAARGGCELDGDPSCGPGDERPYPWGWDRIDCAHRQGIDTNSACPEWGAQAGTNLSPVDALPLGVSPYGVFAMLGNVEEWVADVYVKNYYASCPATDPPPPTQGDRSILRGYQDVELTGRGLQHLEPQYPRINSGVRCARTPSTPPP